MLFRSQPEVNDSAQKEEISTGEAIAEMDFYKAQLESAAVMLETIMMITDRQAGKN